MQALAQEAVYWSGIDADITDHVKRCAICTWHKASLPSLPMLPRDIPSSPLQEIAAGCLMHSGKDYQLIANLFSKYPFPILHNFQVSPGPCPKTPGSYIPIWSPPYVLYTDNCPLQRRVKEVPPKAVHQPYHLIPTFSQIKWVDRMTGEDTEDSSEHCQRCQNIHTDSPQHAITLQNNA